MTRLSLWLKNPMHINGLSVTTMDTTDSGKILTRSIGQADGLCIDFPINAPQGEVIECMTVGSRGETRVINEIIVNLPSS